MTIAAQYKKLSDIEHVLLRPGRYIGATQPQDHDTFYINDEGKVVWKNMHYSPAFLKLFDEVISNSADFSKRVEGKHLNKIEVNVNRMVGTISVSDNGGIPVVKHPEYDQYIPDMIFGELRSGSNFDDEDDSVGTGQNGEGSTLTMIFSKDFEVDTCDGKNRFVKSYLNNGKDRTEEDIRPFKNKGTKITYIPDYERLGITLDDDHFDMLRRRTFEIAATNPHLDVSFNGELIKFKSFKDFTDLFHEPGDSISFGHDRFQVTVFPSNKGFTQIGFINSTNVNQGGTHISYIMNQITGAVREYVKKKTKQDVKPSDIQNHFFLMINATINNPRYNSQTKENLTTLPKDYGTELVIDDKTIQKIVKGPIVASIIEWAENKKFLEELAEQRKKNKENQKASLRDILKYEPATEKGDRKDCILFLCEGDSAANPLKSARDPKRHGVFTLRGKPLNVRGKKIRDLVKNVELNNLARVLGLQFGQEPNLEELRYNQIVIAADMDPDGSHIVGLIVNIFNELWPTLLSQGFIVRLQTPLVRVTHRKQEHEFFNLLDFETWSDGKSGYKADYLKGLGSNDTQPFKRYMFEEKYFQKLLVEDAEDIQALNIAFDKSLADTRKEFLYSEE